ncbi:PREDICTED: la protein 1-like isoform X1 [Ipomoea nil]|uniref:la protein 1-like isoform X1 n=1 Tax=Ipomoea nil TaxID=35883 RepID=UPI000901C2D5|nr:PREDICTED: la protein 1-like isoform X1 [Ipomoea nil]
MAISKSSVDLESEVKNGGQSSCLFVILGDSGCSRFEDAEAAQKARASAVLAAEGGLVVKNFIATLDPVTGIFVSVLLLEIRAVRKKQPEN